MRSIILILSSLAGTTAISQTLDAFSHHYSYAFIEDSTVLLPLLGDYHVEYLARGQWWSYLDPRTPVNYPGEQLHLKELLAFEGSPLMAAEIGPDLQYPDRKVRVVRGSDTLVVELSGSDHLEERMRERTRMLDIPPRPPVLIPFKPGWYDMDPLLNDPIRSGHEKTIDSLWRSNRNEVLALYDTARYTLKLPMHDDREEPLSIMIYRDPNYITQLVLFTVSGPNACFELYRQNEFGVTEKQHTLRVDMPQDGGTEKWVDISHLQQGRYETHLIHGVQRDLFFVTIIGPVR